MLDFLGRISAYWAGLSSLHLLLFVLVIWVVFALILLADARNKLNQWCFIGGMAFSVGVFKEYLYYGIGPSLIASGAWTVSGAQLLYSILSAAFYLLSIPCVLMFAFICAAESNARLSAAARCRLAPGRLFGSSLSARPHAAASKRSRLLPEHRGLQLARRRRRLGRHTVRASLRSAQQPLPPAPPCGRQHSASALGMARRGFSLSRARHFKPEQNLAD